MSSSKPVRLFVFFLVVLLAASGCAADPESRRSIAPPPNAIATSRFDCLEVHATLINDEQIPLHTTLINYAFENHCFDAVDVDWHRAAITGYAVTAESPNPPPIALSIYRETRIVSGRLDGKKDGSEAIRYDAKEADTRFNRVCIDLSHVVVSATPQPQRERPFCVDRPGDSGFVGTRPGFEAAHEKSPNEPVHQEFHFGALWDTNGFPRFRVETGISLHSLSLDDRTISLPDSSARVPANQIGHRVTGWTYDLRFSNYISGPLYVGGHVGAGFGGAHETALHDEAQTVLTGEASGHIVLAGFVGVSKRIGYVQPYGEVDAGGRILFFRTESADSSCSSNCKSATAAWWTISPRAGLDVWIHPNITLGPYASVDALRTSDFSAGLVFAAHLRAFDGH